jgi:uncharacterized protein YndB with AHSA1/START domain
MTTLAHTLDRVVEITARPDTVFRFFTDNGRWASWWGEGSTIEARPGGRVYVRYPNGIEAVGEVIEVEAPETIVFTFGFVSGKPMPPGGSRVTIRVEAVAGGSRLHLTHEFEDAGARDAHVQGWRYQLSLFGNIVSDEVAAEAQTSADTWFRAWSDPEADARERALATVVTPDVSFRDRFSLIDGLVELLPHISASQQFMPGMHLERRGTVRHCQGTVLADWVALGPDGAERGSGTNVFELNADGRIRHVTGLWSPPASTSA